MKHIIAGTAGHIDHGKTALVKALTGVDADRLPEERQRGITIDIGFADLALDTVRIGFVDVPGHERFVKNMLAGAHGLDLVMLVVSADESIMPQTREHFDICRLLNVKSGLVALTKSDLVDSELLDLARAEVEDFVRGSFLEGAPIVAVSSRTGDGIAELKSRLAGLAAAIEPKSIDAVPRLPIDRAFSVKGFGTVVTGTLIAGEIAVGDEMEILPSAIRTRVRNLQVHGHDTGRSTAGQRTAVNLQGVTLNQVERGTVLAPTGRLTPTNMLDAKLSLLPGAPRPLSQRARVRLHHGTAEIMARVVILTSTAESQHIQTELESRAGSSPGTETVSAVSSVVEPGASRFVQFRLESPLTALPGDRFIIRSYSPQVTIGGGTIIDAHPEKHRIRSDVVPVLERLEKAEFPRRLAIMIETAGPRALSAPEIAIRTGSTDKQISSACRELVASGEALEISNSPLTLIPAAAYDDLSRQVIQMLSDYHRREPLTLGLAKEEGRERIFAGLRPEVFRAVIQRMTDEGKITSDRETLRLPSHRPALVGEDLASKQRLEDYIRKTALQAGTLEDAAVSAGIPPDRARKLYALLLTEQHVLRIGDFVFHRDSLEQLKQNVRAHKAVNARIDVGVFKEITGGLTRKYAIPLLEYLDRERVTRRVGNEREIL